MKLFKQNPPKNMGVFSPQNEMGENPCGFFNQRVIISFINDWDKLYSLELI